MDDGYESERNARIEALAHIHADATDDDDEPPAPEILDATRAEASRKAREERDAVRRERGLPPGSNGIRSAAPGRGRPLTPEDRATVRRIAAEHPGIKQDAIAVRFAAATGRKIAQSTVGNVLSASRDPDAPPEWAGYRERPAQGQKAKQAADAAIARDEDSAFTSKLDEVFSAMREIESILSRLSPGARARVLGWFHEQSRESR
jgi:DNA-binding transcriptional regulator YdaS (Cro superfamily)